MPYRKKKINWEAVIFCTLMSPAILMFILAGVVMWVNSIITIPLFYERQKQRRNIFKRWYGHFAWVTKEKFRN